MKPTIVEPTTNGTAAPAAEAQPLTASTLSVEAQAQAAQALFKKFLEDNGFTFEVSVVTPRTGTLVPVAEFLPDGWRVIAVKMIPDGNDLLLPPS